MQAWDSSPLAPMIDKLAIRSSLSNVEIYAFLSLPYRLASVNPGAFLVRDGHPAVDCCALLSGFAHRSKITKDGSRQIFSLHLRGDFVDVQNSLLGVADHNVQTLTRSDVAFIPRQAVTDLIIQHPPIGQALLHDTLVDAAILREAIINLGRRNAYQRIAHRICEMATRLETAGVCKGPCYDWPMTQEELGDATGLTSVHVNRTLRTLRTDGFFEIADCLITILDWSGLQAAGDFTTGYLHLRPLSDRVDQVA